MNDIRKKISRFTFILQSQTQVPLWAIANEKVIYSIAIGKAPAWGPRSKILNRMMSMAYTIKLADFLIFFVGLTRCVYIWWNIKKKAYRKQEEKTFKRVFAGFGASSEDYLYNNYMRQSQDLPLRINWITYQAMHELGCPSLLSIIILIAENSFGYTAKLHNAPKAIFENAIDFLTVCSLNLGMYVFYRAYWKIAKQ